jgi:hypothetical protein
MGLQTHSSDAAAGTKLKQNSIFITDAGEMTIFPGTLFYRQRHYKIIGEPVREHHYQLSIAGAITKTFAVGASAYKIKTDLPTGQDYNQVNGDLGAYWLAHPQWSLGAVFRGVAGSDDTASWLPSKTLPSSGLGTEFRFFEMFKIRYDISYFFEQNSDKRFLHQLGAEVRYESKLVLRTGFSQDDRLAQNRWTAGIGWEGPRLKVGYAFQKEQRQELGDSHSIDMWLDF